MTAIVEWLLRRRSPALATMRIGLACLTLALAAGLALDISIPVKDGHIDLRYDDGDGVPAALIYSSASLGIALIVVGLIWEL